jgi:hypothetical protein
MDFKITVKPASVNNILLVVLYKMQIMESSTIQSIADYLKTQDPQLSTSYRLHIWDNSPVPSKSGTQAMQMCLPKLHIQYTHSPENCSLSKIYNELASRLEVNEYLTILDQDTILPLAYFEELKIAQHEQWPLILPKVECQDLLVSPGKRFFARGIHLKGIDSGATNSKNLLAINSGMSILGKVFQLIKYDERLRFYGTDTYFMRNYEKYFNQAFVLDTPISHSLAVMERRSEDWRIAYIEELMRTFDIIYTNSIWELLFIRAYVIFIRLKHLTGHCN